MSKSLGNLIMVRDLLQNWSSDALRLYLAFHHYRKIWSHDEQELARARQLVHKFHTAISATGGDGSALDPAPAMDAFHQAMEDDLNTPRALDAMQDLADQILKTSSRDGHIHSAQEALKKASRVFGLRLDTTGSEQLVLTGWAHHKRHFIGS